MIFQSFILGNLVSLCVKIINSAVVVGLYYGFLTTFSIGPSYLFLLQARVMEKGTEKKVSATTGFIAGQLMMFISIYYTPLHLALGRPHTITVLAIPYLLFHFFWNNHKHFFDYGSTTRNAMRNLSIQCVFLNNLIFQLFNHFILPSSMLARLVNIYMFRCNNKMLFVTSSFVGWLIGHILFMKWVGLVLVWIQQKNSIRSNGLIRSNKSLVSELRNSMARIFSILLFITCIYYLGRIPSPIFTKKLKVKETSETEEREESEEETDVEIEKTFQRRGTKQEQEVSTEEDPSPSLFLEEKEDPDKIEETEEIRVNGKKKKKKKHEFQYLFKEKKACDKNSPIYETSYPDGNQENSKLEILKEKEEKYLLCFEKPLATLLFDYKQWNRPFRYKKNQGNNQFENVVRNEMSHYFFYPCQSDGKEKISFTYPASLSTFLEMIEKGMSFLTTEKLSSGELYNNWSYTNEKQRNNLNKELIKRIEVLDKGAMALNVFEKKTKLCNDETKKKNLPKKSDPCLHGFSRGRIHFFFSPIILKSISVEKNTETICINKLHNLLLINNYPKKVEQALNKFSIKSKRLSTLSIEKVRSLFAEHPQAQEKSDSKDRIKILKTLFNVVLTNLNLESQRIQKKPIGIKKIRKQVPRWSIYELEEEEEEDLEKKEEESPIRLRKGIHIEIFPEKETNTNPSNNTKYPKNTNTKGTKDLGQVSLIDYFEQPDFGRGIIKSSMRAQRRKTITGELFQANLHSFLFLDRIDKPYQKKEKIDNQGERERKKCKKKDEAEIATGELWNAFFFYQGLRACALLIQSTLRKYIILPSLIIAKNIVRMLLFQMPEWSEDLRDWNREMHIKCTYNGIPFSEEELPKNWLNDGIQIRIIFPFCLKPWHMKEGQKQKDFSCFLTVWGMEVEFPLGPPRKRPSFFQPILNELEKRRRNFFQKTANETKKWGIIRLLKVKKNVNEVSKKKRNPLFELTERDEFSEIKKDLIVGNEMIHKTSVQIQSMDCTNFSFPEKKIKDLTKRTSTIRNQIEKITKENKKEKKKGMTTYKININSNKKSDPTKILVSSKRTWKILKKKNTRLIRKSSFFIKFFIERMYINIFISILNISKIAEKLFFESPPPKKIKIIEKNINNNETNQESINKPCRSRIRFILNRKKSLSRVSNKNSKTFCDFFSFSQSQTYVFYKLSQTQFINFSNLRSVLQYGGTSLFLKKEIQFLFQKQGIFNSELRYKPFCNFEINQWKNWLRGHYQYKYDLSRIKWPRLVPQKWRNGVNQDCMDKKKRKGFYKKISYEKNRLTHYDKQNFFEAGPLQNKKKIDNFKKHYRYTLSLLSSKSIYYENKKDSYIHKSLFQVNNKKELFSNYTKKNLFDIFIPNPLKNYLEENNIMDMEKFSDRKFFDWRILNFCLRNKIDIEFWVDISTKKNPNIKIGNNKYQIIDDKKIDEITKKDLLYFPIYPDEEINRFNPQSTFFDWMGMNDKILSCPISNLELQFFRELVLLLNAYKMKPWTIPIKFLLFNFNGNDNKNITEKKKQDSFIFVSSNQKNSLELKTGNQKEKEPKNPENRGSDVQNRVSLESVLSNQENGVQENSSGSDIKKHKKKKESKNNTKTELNFLLENNLVFQLKWDEFLQQRMRNNIENGALLLRLKNPKEVFIDAIPEMGLGIFKIMKDFILTNKKLLEGRMFIIEPVCLSVQNDGPFFIYQIVGISLIQKNKHEITKRYREKGSVDKKKFYDSIPRHERMAGNRDKNDYDLLVPENILFPNRRRELRTLICFNWKNTKGSQRNSVFYNNVKKGGSFLNKSEDFARKKNKLIKLKFFLWPNYRLEDLVCMNRYWFNTNNGSRFSMIRIYMYPRLGFFY
uniref:Ycf1 protein n=2 Tax=Cardiospermum halicacabum TaxID=289799 RepID=UPI00288B5B4C|nr:Ycf1 protein [Cardiospermum halicacabum]WMV70311.1 Ycf1 protein [Cardiospermum halicacabum]